MSSGMKCPTCKTADLAERELERGLLGAGCAACSGVFIPFEKYLAWQEAAGATTGAGFAEALEAVRAGAGPPVEAEAAGPRLCPACGRFMARYRVSVDLPFHLDRCGGCASLWLEKGEWETLKGRGLHAKLHMVSADAWQHHIREAEARHQQEQRYRTLLGEEAFGIAQEFKRWVDGHARKQIVFAYLEDREVR
jgi:Zn-finger nucleic acid-binding protein